MSACFCGSYDCRSCGPAQGMTYCEAHHRLACETCWTCDCGEPAATEGGACKGHTPMACCACGHEVSRAEVIYDPDDVTLGWCSAKCCTSTYVDLARSGLMGAADACVRMIEALNCRRVAR